MKKIILFVSIVFMLSACKSDDEKLAELIADATKSTLYIPESYDPVSTECDSLYVKTINESNVNKAAQFVELMKEAKSLQRQVEYNNEQKEYWKGLSSTFYKEYSRKSQNAKTKLNKNLKDARSILEDIYNQQNEPKKFIGFLADHKFRAKTNAGQIDFGEYIFILDKNKTQILSAMDGQNEKVLYLFQLLCEIQELGVDCNIDEVDLFGVSDNIKSKIELFYQ